MTDCFPVISQIPCISMEMETTVKNVFFYLESQLPLNTIYFDYIFYFVGNSCIITTLHKTVCFNFICSTSVTLADLGAKASVLTTSPSCHKWGYITPSHVILLKSKKCVWKVRRKAELLRAAWKGLSAEHVIHACHMQYCLHSVLVLMEQYRTESGTDVMFFASCIVYDIQLLAWPRSY